MVASVLAAVGNEFLDAGRSRVLTGDMNQPPSAKGVCVTPAASVVASVAQLLLWALAAAKDIATVRRSKRVGNADASGL